MPYQKWLWAVVLSIGLSACASASGVTPRASNGMVPYGSDGSEIDALAAGLAPAVVDSPRVPGKRTAAPVAQNDCVRKQNVWAR